MQSLPPTTSISNPRRNSTSATVLPRLPIPHITKTLTRYVKSLEPFILEEQLRGGPSFSEAIDTRRRWAEEFRLGFGGVLQERLHALDKESPNNWLDDNIWLQKAYHEWREPLLVHSNYWFSFINDPNVPEDLLRGNFKQQTIGDTAFTYWQVRRAAWIVHRILEFKMQLERHEIYPKTTRTGEWFRHSASLIFNISRIPQPKCDSFSALPDPSDPTARSILLSLHDWFYSVEVLDSQSNVIPAREIENRILKVVNDVQSRLKNGERAVPISVLSADHRDHWEKNLSHLLSLSPNNQETFKAINHSLFAVSLDHYTYVLPPRSEIPPPDTPPEIDAHLHNLRSSHPDTPAHNRWFDKPLTLIVESNSRAGAMGEHSPCDALIPSIIAEHAVVQGIEDDAFPPIGSINPEETTGMGWKRLDWTTDSEIDKACEEAEGRAKKIVDDSDDGALLFKDYGADFIKHIVGLSPDAYIQMAIQLAWYRSRKNFTATYETALTRLFKNGRTETIRSFTCESRAFVHSMTNPEHDAALRFQALSAAAFKHSGLTKQAAIGRGIDRHLLGLRCMLRDDEPLPELFQDKLFKKSQTWKLSTSGLSAGYQLRGTGFGASEWDGYGINYLTGPDYIRFGIESKHSCPKTSTWKFQSEILQALLDMKQTCLDAGHGQSTYVIKKAKIMAKNRTENQPKL
ncbi:acyltransferase ChoActase/COT/CPT [Abortiporus biennis]|nr:acyltransferase ChoActase/COT/CPT [Abortiporus biennis]